LGSLFVVVVVVVVVVFLPQNTLNTNDDQMVCGRWHVAEKGYYCCSRTADSRVGKKKYRSASFFNAVDTSHHCEFYDPIIILHPFEAF